MSDAAANALLEARHLDLRIAGKRLLEGADFQVRRGELVLLVGPSGAGKSLLLQLLAGVLRAGEGELEATGTLALDGRDLLANESRDRGRTIGLVFQDHALFDDLTAQQNLEFAFDHRPDALPPAERDAAARALLAEFGLEGVPHVRALSGGQQQRLAIARTLAQDPDLVIYDEPTTGLDPRSARQVAARIRSTHDDHAKTSIVVTHDVRSLVPIADRVLLLDPRIRGIVEVAPGDIERELLDLEPPPAPAIAATRRSAADRLASFLASSGDVFAGAATCIASLLPRWPRARWGMRFLRRQLELVAWPSAMVYMAIAGAILGVVTTYFTFRYLPMKHYTEDLLDDEILAGMGLLVFRVLGPVLATLLLAARAGAAVSADVGNRTYGRQLDAMRSLGLEPRRYLQTAVSWAFLLGTPLLCAIVFGVATLVSQVVFVLQHFPDRTAFFWDNWYFRRIFDLQTGELVGLGWTFAKVETAGLGIGAIAYAQGASPKRTGSDVSSAINRCILWGTLWVLTVHLLYAFFEF